MINKLLSVIVLVFIASCATTPNVNQLNNLKPGITKSELLEVFGEPEGTSFYDDYYFLTYFVYQPKGWTYEKYHFAFDKNDRLVAWRVGDSAAQVNSMMLSVPLPQLRQ